MNNIDINSVMRMIGLLGDRLGFRLDGTRKGRGYFGELQRPGGGVSTELSSGTEYDGKETQIPLLVPTLTKEEVDWLLSGNEPTEGIYQKANSFAKQRINRNLSPFATQQEEGQTKPGDFQQLMAMLPIIMQVLRKR